MTNFAKVNLDTKAQTDQVVGSYSGSFSAAGDSQITKQVISNGLGVQTFFYGQFNVDGGSYLSLDGVVVIGGLEKLYAAIYEDSSGNFTLWVENTDSVSHTIGYEIVAIAAPGNGTIAPFPTSQKALLNSNYNYPKIALSGSQTVSISSSSDTQVTIPHNLGYIPYARFWVGWNGNLYNLASNTFQPGVTVTEVQIDTSNVNTWLTATTGTATATMYWRVYYDS